MIEKIFTTKIIIAGGRDFNDYELLKKTCDEILKTKTAIEIVSGTAKGADKLGEKYAAEKGYPTVQFPADWNTHGKSAGIKRNGKMADYADELIAFWDGKSKGTDNMIRTAKRYKLKVHVINYENKNGGVTESTSQSSFPSLDDFKF